MMKRSTHSSAMTAAELRQQDVPEPLGRRRAVDPRRLLQLAGHRLEPGEQEQEREREVAPRLERDDGQQGERDVELQPKIEIVYSPG